MRHSLFPRVQTTTTTWTNIRSFCISLVVWRYHSDSFLPKTVTLWNRLQREWYSDHYNLNGYYPTNLHFFPPVFTSLRQLHSATGWLYCVNNSIIKLRVNCYFSNISSQFAFHTSVPGHDAKLYQADRPLIGRLQVLTRAELPINCCCPRGANTC